MAVYRVYKLRDDGRISGPPHVIDCSDDDAAMREVRRLLKGHVREVWDLCRSDAWRHRGIGPILSRGGAGRAVSRRCREAMMTGLAREERAGLLVLPENFTVVHRYAIITLAARYRLPAVYPYRFFTASGGLMSYGIDPNELFRRAASYVDRILKGAKPADMPVQNPDKFELVINLKTAQALGITVAPPLLTTADEVIE
jgi:hypothetical protein